MAPKKLATRTACQEQDGNLLNALPEQALQTIFANLSITDKTFFAKSIKWCHDLVCEHVKEIIWFLSCDTRGAAATLSKAGKRKAEGLTLRMNLEGCTDAMISNALHQCISRGPYTAVKRLLVRGQAPDSKTLCSGFGSLLGLALPAVEELSLRFLRISGSGLFCSLQHCKGLRKLTLMNLELSASAARATPLIKEWAPGLTSIYDVTDESVVPIRQYADQVQELTLPYLPDTTFVSSCTSLTAISLECRMDRELLQGLCSLPHLQHVTVASVQGVAAAGGGASDASLVPARPWHTLTVKGPIMLQDLPLLPLAGLQLLDLSAGRFTTNAEPFVAAAVQTVHKAGAALLLPASVKWECMRLELWASAYREMGGEDDEDLPPYFLEAKAAVAGAISSLLQRHDTPATLVIWLGDSHNSAWCAADVSALGQGLASVDWASHEQPLAELHLEPVRVDGPGFWAALRTALPPSLQTLHLALALGGAQYVAPHNGTLATDTGAVHDKSRGQQLGLGCAAGSAGGAAGTKRSPHSTSVPQGALGPGC